MSKFSALLKPVSRFVLTAFLLLITAYLLVALWNAYVRAPWTRDGRVSAQIVRIAPEVSGTVREMAVTDNQRVHKGMFCIAWTRRVFSWRWSRRSPNWRRQQPS